MSKEDNAPKAPTKSEIYAMYPTVPKSELKRYINDIIATNRGLNKLAAGGIRKNILFPKEFELLKDIVGEPIVI